MRARARAGEGGYLTTDIGEGYIGARAREWVHAFVVKSHAFVMKSHAFVIILAYLCNVLAALGQVPSQQLSQLESFLAPKSLRE